MPLPPDYNTVPVFCEGYVYLDGTPAAGTVKFTGKNIAVSDVYNKVILPNTLTATLDVNGAFTVNIPATDDPDILPNGWTYKVEELFDAGGGRTMEIEVPLASLPTGVDLSEVAPLPADFNPSAFVTLSAFEAWKRFSKTWTRSGAATVTVGDMPWYNPFGRTIAINGVLVAAGVAPTGADLIVDVNKNGTTIFTTQANRPRILAGQFVSTVAVPNIMTLAPGDRLTVDIDQVGSTVAGSQITTDVVLS